MSTRQTFSYNLRSKLTGNRLGFAGQHFYKILPNSLTHCVNLLALYNTIQPAFYSGPQLPATSPIGDLR
jgi:hypothetical protein